MSEYVAYAPSEPDLTSVHSVAGDFNKKELASAVDRSVLTGDAAAHYKKLAAGTRAICYCVSIQHSKNTSEYFNANGISAAHIDGTTPRDEQHSIIQGFASGRYDVLCNVELITTGFDLSAQVGRDVPVETIILLRPTQSEALHLQMIGRGLRRKPRPAIILDHSGNIFRHGLPDDDREWNLEGRKRKGRKADDQQALIVRQCEQCYHVHRPAPACPKCGCRYEIQAREVEQVDGELTQVDPDEVRRIARAEQKKARTLEDLQKIERKRGYKKGWSAYVYAARQGKRQARRVA